MRKVKLSTNQLTVGLYIQLPRSWRRHPFLFNSFIIQEPQQIRVLQSLDFEHVICIPEKSTSAPLPINQQHQQPPVVAPQDDYLDALWQEKERRIEEQRLYLRNLRNSENQFKKSLAMVRSINLKLNTQTAQALNDASELITHLADKISSTDRTVLHLMEEGKREMSSIAIYCM